MDECIEREAVYRAFSTDDTLSGYEKAYCREIIKKIPASDVAPVRSGRWLNANRRQKTYQRICTACGGMAYFCGIGCSYKYCPNCGCRMDGGEDDGTST